MNQHPVEAALMEIVVDRCPNCDATTVTPGTLRDLYGYTGAFAGFEPAGMQWFSFRWRRGVTLAEAFRCCLACGHVWARLPAEQLRIYMKKHGDWVAKRAVEPFEKKVVDQELA
jgi:hypothetical protein